MSDPSARAPLDLAVIQQEAKNLVARITEWMGLPDSNEARDKQRAILLLDQACDLIADDLLAIVTAQQQELIEEHRKLDEAIYRRYQLEASLLDLQQENSEVKACLKALTTPSHERSYTEADALELDRVKRLL